jgi:ABC-type polysaccharide/polyol phosphate transport system ATPase subunit
MAEIELENASFHYPVFEMGARSLKVSLFAQMSGGKVDTNAGVVMVKALNDINMSLQDGDRIALLGRNGSGKSTLLRVLAGLAFPQYGKVKIKGRVVPLITQGLGINPEISGFANIELPLRLLGATTAEVKRAKEEIPEFTGLGEFMNLPVRTYSDGMKARLSFAICTAIEADILILDEWLGAGDIDFQEKAQTRIREMVDRTRIVVLATHSLDLARSACNTAMWLDRGNHVMTGPPDVVTAAYTEAMQQPLRIAVGQ